MISAGDIQVRADICRACPAPCEIQHDGAAHADGCRACPVRRWGRNGCRAGDKLAGVIREKVLAPAEAVGGAVAAVAEGLAKCGGCRSSQRSLNGGGDLPGDEPVTVI